MPSLEEIRVLAAEVKSGQTTSHVAAAAILADVVLGKEHAVVAKTTLKLLFNRTVYSVSFVTRSIDLDEVMQVRLVAMLLGIDPIEATPIGMRCHFGHHLPRSITLLGLQCARCGDVLSPEVKPGVPDVVFASGAIPATEVPLSNLLGVDGDETK